MVEGKKEIRGWKKVFLSFKALIENDQIPTPPPPLSGVMIKKLLTNFFLCDIFLPVVKTIRNARVAQRWSTSLPRRGSRVRSPSRALKEKHFKPL